MVRVKRVTRPFLPRENHPDKCQRGEHDIVGRFLSKQEILRIPAVFTICEASQVAEPSVSGFKSTPFDGLRFERARPIDQWHCLGESEDTPRRQLRPANVGRRTSHHTDDQAASRRPGKTVVASHPALRKSSAHRQTRLAVAGEQITTCVERPASPWRADPDRAGWAVKLEIRQPDCWS